MPRVIHFITGLREDFGGKPFSFVHATAIRSALAVNPGYRVKLHLQHEPTGRHWESVRDPVVVHVAAPTEVFGRPLEHFAHRADVLRLDILLREGGVYLDLDTICVRPFEPLLQGPVVMGPETRSDGVVVGLCNAVIIAAPGAEFLRRWRNAYRDFSDRVYNAFSVRRPAMLAQRHPGLLRIEPPASFFLYPWDAEGRHRLFRSVAPLDGAYSLHLWESTTWRLIGHLDEQAVRRVDSTYNLLARRFLP